MAKAEKKTKIRRVPRTVYDEVPETVYMLELNEYEARVLRLILNRIGGSPEGPRGQADKINEAFNDTKIAMSRMNTDSIFSKNGHNTINFENMTEEQFNERYNPYRQDHHVGPAFEAHRTCR